MAVRIGGSPRVDAGRRARRVGLVLGGSSIAWNLVLATVPAAAAAPIVPTAPKYSDVFCDPAVGNCTTAPITGLTDTFTASGTGGSRKATLVSVVNDSTSAKPGPSCPGFEAGDSDWLSVGFRDLRAGATWTKVIGITATVPTTRQVAVAAARRDLVCFSAPYRFFVRPGYKLAEGPRERGPYSGVLASCSTVDSLFPTEFRNRVQPLPCVLLRRAVPSGSGWVVQSAVRIPRDTAVTHLRHNN